MTASVEGVRRDRAVAVRGGRVGVAIEKGPRAPTLSRARVRRCWRSCTRLRRSSKVAGPSSLRRSKPPVGASSFGDDGLFEDSLPAGIVEHPGPSEVVHRGGQPWSGRVDDEGWRRHRSPPPRRPRHTGGVPGQSARRDDPVLVPACGSGGPFPCVANGCGEQRLGVTCVLSEAGGGLNGALLRAGRIEQTRPRPHARGHRQQGHPPPSSTASNSPSAPSRPPFCSSPTPSAPTARPRPPLRGHPVMPSRAGASS